MAKCNSGDIATGGGFVLGGKVTIKSSTPLTTGNGWKATAFVFVHWWNIRKFSR